jgi:hypothetical protein
MARRSQKALRNDRVDPFMAGYPRDARMPAHLAVLMVGTDLGANPIYSVGDGALLPGTGTGAGAGSIVAGAGAGAGVGSSCHKRVCTVVPDVGANPITSVGDGALLHGAGAGAGTGSISASTGTGAGAGAGSSGASEPLANSAELSTAVGVHHSSRHPTPTIMARQAVGGHGPSAAPCAVPDPPSGVSVGTGQRHSAAQASHQAIVDSIHCHGVGGGHARYVCFYIIPIIVFV